MHKEGRKWNRTYPILGVKLPKFLLSKKKPSEMSELVFAFQKGNGFVIVSIVPSGCF